MLLRARRLAAAPAAWYMGRMDADTALSSRMNAGPLRTRLATLALALLLPAATAGCGFFLVHGPPAAHETLTTFSCTRSNAGPVLDAVAAGTALLVGTQLLAGGGGDAEGWTAPYRVVGAGFALEGLVFGSSAALGFRKTSRCREAPRQLTERGARPAAAAPPR